MAKRMSGRMAISLILLAPIAAYVCFKLTNNPYLSVSVGAFLLITVYYDHSLKRRDDKD